MYITSRICISCRGYIIISHPAYVLYIMSRTRISRPGYIYHVQHMYITSMIRAWHRGYVHHVQDAYVHHMQYHIQDTYISRPGYIIHHDTAITSTDAPCRPPQIRHNEDGHVILWWARMNPLRNSDVNKMHKVTLLAAFYPTEDYKSIS